FGLVRVELGQGTSWDTLATNSHLRQRTRELEVKVSAVHELGRFPVVPALVDAHSTSERAEIEAAARRTFQETLHRWLALAPRREVWLMVHGYHNTFEKPAMVLAELWHFMGREAVPVLYSWPAGRGGLLRGYAYDRESGEFTVYHLKQCLRLLAEDPQIEKIHILAHSRGAAVCVAALRELIIAERAAGRGNGRHLKIGQVVLAAPDLDLEVASQRVVAEGVLECMEHLTVYVSSRDKAIWLANWLFDSQRRLGNVDLGRLNASERQLIAKVPGVDFIQADLSSGFLTHSYFYEHPAVVSDLILVLRDGRPAGAEHGRPLQPVSKNFWRLSADYPGTRRTGGSADVRGNEK
ncbi:MAG: alpha/beta hydrolase, partial [Verrucomicrobia bacterium]